MDKIVDGPSPESVSKAIEAQRTLDRENPYVFASGETWGLRLRDYAAVQIMASMSERVPDHANRAQRAWALADAFLEARNAK